MEIEALQRDDVQATTIEYYNPVYRVDFWRHLDPPPGHDPSKMGYKLEAYRLHKGESLDQVREWADATADGRGYVIWIEFSAREGRGIARVEGTDPTRN